mmetsp:Transcript_50018/g.60398  ORF Transcript_50018/g.60398 Transcript_50018/m.60398 type:complete len:110 (+) Transcript_50018:363-692(+)
MLLQRDAILCYILNAKLWNNVVYPGPTWPPWARIHNDYFLWKDMCWNFERNWRRLYCGACSTSRKSWLEKFSYMCDAILTVFHLPPHRSFCSGGGVCIDGAWRFSQSVS